MADNCGVCGKEASNQYVVIKDVRYHAECFKCKTCGMSLGGKPYIQTEGDFLCQDCYYAKMGKKCAHCEEVIKGQYIEAMGTTWCPEHFVCAACGEPFKDDTFYKHDNHPYCETHYRELTSEDCSLCGEKIMDGEMMEGGEKKYHMKCFVCEEDKKQIGDGEKYHEYNGKLYCDDHLKAKLTLTCSVCGKPITGEYIMIGGEKMHKACRKSGSTSTSTTSTSTKKPGSGGSTSKTSGGSGSTTTVTTTTITPAPSTKKDTTKKAPQTTEKAPATTTETKTDEEEAISFYAYASLTIDKTCPPGVHPSTREQHLEDGEFEKLFGCNKAAFSKLPKWKKKAKKLKLNLW